MLIVDDEILLARNLRKYLERRRHQVASARNGEEGLEQIARFRPQVVVLDINLPGMSGLEVLRAIRARHPALQVIVWSAHPEAKETLAATRLFVLGFFSKPARLADLADCLAESSKCPAGCKAVCPPWCLPDGAAELADPRRPVLIW